MHCWVKGYGAGISSRMLPQHCSPVGLDQTQAIPAGTIELSIRVCAGKITPKPKLPRPASTEMMLRVPTEIGAPRPEASGGQRRGSDSHNSIRSDWVAVKELNLNAILWIYSK